MKVLLIDPGFGEDSFHTFGASHWSSIINHGLCSIGTYARDVGGFDVELLDIRKLKGWDYFRHEVADRRPTVVGISMRSCDEKVVVKAIDVIKGLDAGIQVVVGGPHPTIVPEDMARFQNIDHIILGEGEISFTALLENIRDGKAVDRVIVGERPDLDQLPLEDREFYDYRVSMNLPNYPGLFAPPMVTMITVRGCAFRCGFCAPHAEKMFGKKVRYRSVDRVIEDLQILRDKYHFKSLKFYNSDFMANTKYVYELCDKLEANGFIQPILIQTRASSLCRDELAVKRLKDVGLKLVLMGFESGSQRMLDFMQKGCKVEHNIRAAEICRKYDLIFSGSFMFGLPTETAEDVRLSVELARKIRPHFTSVAFFTPLPGTYLYDYVQERGLSLVEGPDDLLSFSPSKPKIKGVDYEVAKAGAEEILGMKFGGPLMGKLIRWMYVNTKKNLRLRQFLVKCWYWYVSTPLHRWTQRVSGIVMTDSVEDVPVVDG